MRFTIQETDQCPAERTRVRIVAQFDTELKSILEILFLHLKNASYSKGLGCIVMKKDGGITSIFGSGRVSITYLKNKQEGITKLNRFATLFSKAFEYLELNGPVDQHLIQQHENLNALELLKLLPQTNCGDCGETGCFPFASRLLLGDYQIEDCKELLGDEKSKMRRELEAFLQPINLDIKKRASPSLADLLGFEKR
ncbi:MAG: (Fe-S)-binding protein [Candidatus Thorarchaeota archaeon]